MEIPNAMYFTHTPFSKLSVHALYEIMACRQEVFVVEQNCPYLDADGKDLYAWHLQGRNREGKLVAYARLLPQGQVCPRGGGDETYPSIGRVLVMPEYRAQGLGKRLMREAISQCRSLFGPQVIEISAQKYLQGFYMELGFKPTGKEYLEDGIPHLQMRWYPR